MKLRQKLAMVLATAMIVTAVPVVTMAASENGFNKTITVVADKAITTNQGLALDVRYTTGNVSEDVFYIVASDFEFEKEAYNHKAEDGTAVAGTVATEGFTVNYISEDELEVIVDAETALEKVSVPVAGTPQEGTPTLTVDAKDSFATSTTHTFGEVTSDKTLVATADDATNISVEGNGKIADIIIEEKIAGEISGEVITITLPNKSDLIFASTNTVDTVVIEGSRGLGDIAAAPAQVEIVDEKEIQITMPESTSTRTGSVAIQGIAVAPEDSREDVQEGEVEVTVSAEDMEDTDLIVANIADYGVTFEVKEVETLTAGHGDTTVTVTIEETTAGSLNGKPVYLTMDGAEFVSVEGDNVAFTDSDNDEITLTPSEDETKAHAYEFEITLAAEAGTEGDVTLLAEGRGLAEDMEIEVATVEAPFTIETETFNMKAGVKDQKGGKIVITESAEETFAKSEEIVIKAEDGVLKITDAEVNVTGGDIEITSDTNKDGELVITVERTSDEVSEITIENIEVSAPGYMPEGGYDFVVGGGIVAEANTTTEAFEQEIALEDFVVIGEQQVEGEASYKVGDKTFIHNGEEKEMDVAPYITSKDRVMVPVRFVAEAFGIASEDLAFDQATGTVTIFRGDDIIQLVNGEAMALVNGIRIPMEEKMTIKEDRTFIPVGELARILDIQVEWDNETKTATFTN